MANALVDAIRGHGLGLVLVIVPNHMGVANDNHWWDDVLENGPASRFTGALEACSAGWQPPSPMMNRNR